MPLPGSYATAIVSPCPTAVVMTACAQTAAGVANTQADTQSAAVNHFETGLDTGRSPLSFMRQNEADPSTALKTPLSIGEDGNPEAPIPARTRRPDGDRAARAMARRR